MTLPDHIDSEGMLMMTMLLNAMGRAEQTARDVCNRVIASKDPVQLALLEPLIRELRMLDELTQTIPQNAKSEHRMQEREKKAPPIRHMIFAGNPWEAQVYGDACGLIRSHCKIITHLDQVRGMQSHGWLLHIYGTWEDNEDVVQAYKYMLMRQEMDRDVKPRQDS